MSAKRFRIAFSFAGEKRDFVAKVAQILADRFGEAAILYDKYHEAEFSRARLGRYLPKLYHEESDLVVVVICHDYENKEWCGLEWDAIFDLLKKHREADVMLCRFEHAKVEGLFSDTGYSELDDKPSEEFANLILERLAINEGHPKDYYTKLSTPAAFTKKTSIPHNLPTLQPFFGREDELKKIADALDPESRTWGALIDGPGGMGKTSLAVCAAYDVSPEVFNRIIFVSLKTRELDDNGLRDLNGFFINRLAELFNELARELGHDDIAEAAEDQRPRLLLEALRGTQTLLVLDNLESLVKRERDIVFTFAKKLPAGCKAILTARGRIGSGAEELILDKLSEQAALATLEELAMHNPHLAMTSEADRLTLYRETSGKPLLLRWTAGQIGRGHCLTITDALHFLRSCPEGNDPLEFIFGDLLKEFNDVETKVLCTLTHFTLPAKVEHVAAIAGLPESDTDRALRSLVNRSLAVPTDELKAFTLVPMVGDFMWDKNPEIMMKIGVRLEERAYELIIENGYKKFDRFPALEAAWPSIAPALALFPSIDNGKLQTICDALGDFLNFRGRWDERLALNDKAEAKAVAAADYNKAGRRAYDAGRVHYQRGQADSVVACADRATAHWIAARAGVRELASAILLRGQGHLLKKNCPAAITAFREVLELDRSLSLESVDVAISMNELAGAERLSSFFTEAEEHFREALRIARAVSYTEGEAYITGNLAELAIDRKDWLAAEVLARKAMLLSESVPRQDLIATVNYHLACALVRQRKAAEALPHAQRAVEIYTRLRHPELDKAQTILVECEGKQ